MAVCVWPWINVSLNNLQHANNNLHVIRCIHTQNRATFGSLVSLCCRFYFRLFFFFLHLSAISTYRHFLKTLFGHFESCTICLLLLALSVSLSLSLSLVTLQHYSSTKLFWNYKRISWIKAERKEWRERKRDTERERERENKKKQEKENKKKRRNITREGRKERNKVIFDASRKKRINWRE